MYNLTSIRYVTMAQQIRTDGVELPAQLLCDGGHKTLEKAITCFVREENIRDAMRKALEGFGGGKLRFFIAKTVTVIEEIETGHE